METIAWVQVLLAVSLLLIMALVGIWDIYATFYLPYGHTVSWLIQGWAINFPALPFALGFLFGHLFWPIIRR